MEVGRSKVAVLCLLLVGLAVVLGTGGLQTETTKQPSGEVSIIGPEEVVFDWTKDRCDMNDVPDLPARAFRDADGKVQLIATHYIGRRMIGNTLDTVKRDCRVMLNSDMNGDPAMFDDHEWLASFYTLDGQTIYALVHNEYQGNTHRGWQASVDFSSTQGTKNWYYQEWTGSSYRDMVFDARNNRWKGSQLLCLLGPDWAHPDSGREPARKWVSPLAGTVTVAGNAHDGDPGGGDGVVVKILKGKTELWSKTIANGDTKGYDFSLQVPVEVGDAIYFRVNMRGDPGHDTTYFNAGVVVGADPCPSGEYMKCWYNAITLVKSTDKGVTYTHAAAPGHLVASPPYPYEADSGTWGFNCPGNIVFNPKDGFYYALLYMTPYRMIPQGVGVMRTKTLDDPSSWRAWGGNGFNVRFANPYAEPSLNPLEHVPVRIPYENIGGMDQSLTFNTYFGKWLLVGTNSQWVNGQCVNEGIYYSLSDDLVNWSLSKLLMPAKLQMVGQDQSGELIQYPSLIDPDDTSRNFEITGQRPYLYFTRFHPATAENQGLDRDLVRVRIEFQ
jgi:hypothetical protein